jgi:hypothetical protein
MSFTVMVSGRLIERQSARSIKSSKERSSIAARCISVARNDKHGHHDKDEST